MYRIIFTSYLLNNFFIHLQQIKEKNVTRKKGHTIIDYTNSAITNEFDWRDVNNDN